MSRLKRESSATSPSVLLSGWSLSIRPIGVIFPLPGYPSCRPPKNRKYITYCNVVRGGSSFVSTVNADRELREVWSCSFWATVCKTVRPMLSDRCLSVCLSVCPVLSLTLVYCGQTVGRIKMKLGRQVGLGPGHIVLDGDSAPAPPKGAEAPNFWPVSVAAKWLQESTYHLVWR